MSAAASFLRAAIEKLEAAKLDEDKAGAELIALGEKLPTVSTAELQLAMFHANVCTWLVTQAEMELRALLRSGPRKAG